MLQRARPGLGTLVEIAIEPEQGSDPSELFAAAFELVDSLEAQLSVHRADSELNRVCSRAAIQPQLLSPALHEVLQLALDLHRQSGGIFDVARPYADGATTHSGSADIDLSDDGRLFLRQPLQIDLGGIAKGYVIDGVVERLRRSGVRSGRVNAGGDLRLFGEATGPVALRFADGFRRVAQLCDGAFAASRPGPRPMARASAINDHYDGRSRQPVSLQDTVAVFAERAVIADALTKIALSCARTMDRVCTACSAQWRRYPFDIAARSESMRACNAA
jgi:thiamine biosynthesis lipoprotein